MVLARRLLDRWPDGTLGLDRPRWVTAAIALGWSLGFGLGLAISVTEGALIVGAVLLAAAAAVYRLDLGLYSLADSKGIRTRQVFPWKIAVIRWDEVAAIGVTRAFTPTPQGVIACRLLDGSTVALPSTLYRPDNARLQRQLEALHLLSGASCEEDLEPFGPLVRRLRPPR